MKILNIRNVPNDKTIYRNEKYEKAIEKGTISQYKVLFSNKAMSFLKFLKFQERKRNYRLRNSKI